MARPYGKKNVASFFRKKLKSSRRSKLQLLAIQIPLSTVKEKETASECSEGAKKKAGSRLWMLFDRSGKSEVMELDKSVIMRRASISARDVRILGSLFAHSCRIIVREKAMVVNLEFIKVIITADEVLLLNPLSIEVLPFVDQLRRQICLSPPSKFHESGNENDEDELVLPFELKVLKVALETVCNSLDSNVGELARTAYAALDDLTVNVNNKNLERIRSLKSNLTRLLARVQKVRDEIEHILDNNEDMSQLYLTRKQIQNQQFEAKLASATSNTVAPAPKHARKYSHDRRGSSSVSFHFEDDNEEDLEMLFEAYFMQLERSRNKILSMREYIDYTEDYVNFQLGNQRNELIRLQMFLAIFSFAMGVESMIAGALGMNLQCSLFYVNNLFTTVVVGSTVFSFLIFFLLLQYARWKKLFGS